jgi:hypothetical protein
MFHLSIYLSFETPREFFLSVAVPILLTALLIPRVASPPLIHLLAQMYLHKTNCNVNSRLSSSFALVFLLISRLKDFYFILRLILFAWLPFLFGKNVCMCIVPKKSRRLRRVYLTHKNVFHTI